MSAETNVMTVPLPYATSERLLAECQEKFLLPRQVVARSLGETLNEPTLITIPDKYVRKCPLSEFSKFYISDPRDKGHQKNLYLLIVSQIVKATTDEKFAEVIKHKPLQGTRRVYFGRSREEVESRRSNTQVEPIPETEWFADVHNSGQKKQQILEHLMQELQYSDDYTWMVSRIPNHQRLPLPPQAIHIQSE